MRNSRARRNTDIANTTHWSLCIWFDNEWRKVEQQRNVHHRFRTRYIAVGWLIGTICSIVCYRLLLFMLCWLLLCCLLNSFFLVAAGQLYSVMPVIWLKPVDGYKYNPRDYQCPLYIT